MMYTGGGEVIRIAICDDEKPMSDHIRKMTSDFFRGKNTDGKETAGAQISGVFNFYHRYEGTGVSGF